MARVKTKLYPVAPRKRYRFLIEWISEDIVTTLTVSVLFYDKDETLQTTQVLWTKAATAVNVWQIDTVAVIPTPQSRYAQIQLEGTNGVKMAFSRVELKESETSLERSAREIEWFDDFIGVDTGVLPWTKVVAAGTLTLSKINSLGAAGAWSELGILRMVTSNAANDGGLIHLDRIAQGIPPVGSEFRCKIRTQNTNNARGWFGLWESLALYPDEALANSISGIGIRYQTGAAAENWFGVVRNGTTETTVDLGVQANSTWRDLGFYINSTGVRFTVNGDSVGSTVTTNHPDTTDQLAPVIGLLAANAAAKTMDIDYFGFKTTLNRV